MKKFYFILAALLAAVTVNAADWYLVGGNVLNGGSCWSDNAQLKFTPKAGSSDELTLQISELKGEFKVKEAGGSWSSSFGGNGSKLKEGVLYNAGYDGGNITVDGSIADATITINTKNHTVLVTGASAENEYTDIYLIGNFGSSWDEAITTYPLKLVAGSTDTYEGKFTLSAATSYFKMKAGAYIYGTGGNDVAVELGESYTASQSGNAFSIGEGTYTFKFVLKKNADTGVLTVNGEAIVTFPETLNVIGNVNGLGWAPNNVIAMDNEGDGIFSVSEIAIGGEMGTEFGYFSFCEKEGPSASDWSVGSRYGAETTDTEPVFDADGVAELPIVKAGDPASFKVLEGKYNMTINLEDMILSIEKIEEVVIEPVTSEGAIAAGADGWKQTGTPQGATEVFAPAGSYAITYNADKTLTFVLNLDETCVGLVPQLFINGAYKSDMAALARDGGSWTATTNDTYELGETVPFSFYCAYAGGLSETNTMSYEVGSQTGIDAVEVSADAPVEYYTIQGVKVAGKLANGLYIAKQGNKVTKILVK